MTGTTSLTKNQQNIDTVTRDAIDFFCVFTEKMTGRLEEPLDLFQYLSTIYDSMTRVKIFTAEDFEAFATWLAEEAGSDIS